MNQVIQVLWVQPRGRWVRFVESSGADDPGVIIRSANDFAAARCLT